MNTSEFDKSSLAQLGFPENAETAWLPDIDELTKLANELFSAAPCDGSRLGIVASALPDGLTPPGAGFDKVGVTAISPKGPVLPGEAQLRQLFAPKQSLGNVPDSLDTGPVIGTPPSAATTGLASPLAGLDEAVLAGIFPHNFGLPGEAELKQLLVSRTPSGSHLPSNIDAISNPATQTSVAGHEFAADSLANTEKYAEADISPQVYEAELQKLFAINSAATGRIPKSASAADIPVHSIPASIPTPGLTGSLTNLDATKIAGLSPEVYGLPGEAELQKLFASFSTPPGNVPASAGSGSSFYFLDEVKHGGVNALSPSLGAAHPPFDVNICVATFQFLKNESMVIPWPGLIMQRLPKNLRW